MNAKKGTVEITNKAVEQIASRVIADVSNASKPSCGLLSNVMKKLWEDTIRLNGKLDMCAIDSIPRERSILDKIALGDKTLKGFFYT
ncbi:hypothetical protein M1N11_05350 [Peptococcaceae bacterium]|nr:hypothetical protein [Peptococcaceae bacterium]